MTVLDTLSHVIVSGGRCGIIDRLQCNYTYIANTISMYAEPATEPPVDRMSSTLKPAAKNAVVTGIYKDDDSKYSLENLLKRQGEGDLR